MVQRHVILYKEITIRRRLLISTHSSSDSKTHINHTANAISALDIANQLIMDCNPTSVNTHMHIMEAIVDRRKSALVGNIFIDFDLSVQVI